MFTMFYLILAYGDNAGISRGVEHGFWGILFLVGFVLGWVLSEVPKNSLNMGGIKYGKSTENGFLGKFMGGSRGILGNLVFG